MSYDVASYKHSELTKQIIGIFYEVYNILGYGFLERVYENALASACGKPASASPNNSPSRSTSTAR